MNTCKGAIEVYEEDLLRLKELRATSIAHWEQEVTFARLANDVNKETWAKEWLSFAKKANS